MSTVKDSIVEGNKIIAGFVSESKESYSKYGDFIPAEYCNSKSSEAEYFIWERLQYHTSWDWLMPVWSKCIEVIGVYMHTHADARVSKLWIEKSGEISNFISAVDIRSSFHRISHLIQWYNQQFPSHNKPTT